jgi:hypothetical protein
LFKQRSAVGGIIDTGNGKDTVVGANPDEANIRAVVAV